MTIDPADLRPAARADNQDPALFGQTPSQTVGPFFHYGLPWKGGADLVGRSDMGARPELIPEAHYVLNLSAPTGTPCGEVIEITGRVLDGRGAPVPDAMIELWQANAAGRYRSVDDPRDEVPIDPHFVGFGRAATGQDGRYRFRTIISRCRSLRAALSSGWRPACTFETPIAMTTIPYWRWYRPSVATR